MSTYLIVMVELFFIAYHIPRTMSRLARENRRSSIAWSLIGAGAWLAGQFIVALVFVAIYGTGIALLGWSNDYSDALVRFVYAAALAAGGVCLILAERRLYSRAGVKSYTLPPPPPKF
jgi:hypothetical protein